ncbi:hypothetical protein [Alkalilimnicola sp. S0819]|uniref:hypothetical protein n=1 Tax=Alkalilimnicola sp. S0819 TaxID=2613922 RepID=UPI0012615E0D|nr:hypothetical protein [Alkalilimnicola sp. S0819]KAB7622865.1 hypothetical protein F3N43_11120 [Alkalilimnicola sp. S0819]MPQ17187.1 hypothetical protein [Alkalilimnicola sp. S0819]
MTRSNTLMLRSLALVFSSALIVACNSGGGGSSKPSPAPGGSTLPAPDSSTDTGGSTGGMGGSGGSANGNTGGGATGGTGSSSAALRWVQPTQNTDGSPLRDLVGYKVSYGLSPSTYNQTLALDFDDVDCQQNADDQRVCSYTVENLSAASWYFAVKATDMDGNDSAYSNEVVVTVQ